ncbi:MAG TPA: HU family DNA-binding protein [Rhodanobacteraceae bacterium]
MNKQDLVVAVAKQSGDSVAATRRSIAAVFEVITAELKAGREVTIVGFGRFHTAKRAARKGHNPRTGAGLKIPARRVPKFTAGQTLKRAVDRRKTK